MNFDWGTTSITQEKVHHTHKIKITKEIIMYYKISDNLKPQEMIGFKEKYK